MFDSSKTIHGRFAKILKNGKEMTNCTECTAKVDIDKIELKTLGDDWVRYKAGFKKGTGSFSGYHVTSELIKNGFDRFELIVTLEDPESYGAERIRLKNCMADSVNLVDLKGDEVVMESTPFTFEDYELLDAIEEN